MKPLNILIVDDHPFMRTALSDMLAHAGLYNIMTAESGYEAIAYADEYDLDLVIMDIVMPEMDGIETTGKLIKKHPGLKILVLTGAYNKESIFTMLEAGAMGCILKDAKEEEVNLAVAKVIRGEYYFGSKPMKDILVDFKEVILPRKVVPRKEFSTLTNREKEIIKYLSQGLVNKEIAQKLFLSKRTVDKHRTNILKKLKVNNSAELIAYAVKYGLVE